MYIGNSEQIQTPCIGNYVSASSPLSSTSSLSDSALNQDAPNSGSNRVAPTSPSVMSASLPHKLRHKAKTQSPVESEPPNHKSCELQSRDTRRSPPFVRSSEQREDGLRTEREGGGESVTSLKQENDTLKNELRRLAGKWPHLRHFLYPGIMEK